MASSSSCILNRDPITPHKLAIGALIRQYVKCSNHSHDTSLPLPNNMSFNNMSLNDIIIMFNVKREEFGGDQCHLSSAHLSKLVVFILEQINDGKRRFEEQSFDELCTSLVNKLGTLGVYCFRNLYESLHGIQTPDDMFDAFSVLSDTLAYVNVPVDPEEPCLVQLSSSIGMFLRRCVLSSAKLSFSQAAQLFVDLCDYREIGSELSKKVATVSSDHVRKYVVNQIDSLKRDLILDEVTNEEIESRIDRLREACNGVPEVHFLCYLHALYTKQYEEAMENIHRYFDYVSVGSGSKHESMPQMTHYAVLNLAILHHSFGHMKEALVVVEEAVRMAQQNRSSHCLSHALAVLVEIAQGHGDAHQTKQLLSRCLCNQSEESSEMISRAWLMAAKYDLQRRSGRSRNPLYVWANLSNSVHLNVQHDLDGVQSMHDTLRSTAWHVYGSSALSFVWSEAQLANFSACAPEDANNAMLQLVDNAHASSAFLEAMIESPLLEYHQTSVKREITNSSALPPSHVDGCLLLQFDWAVVSNDVKRAGELIVKLSELLPHQSMNVPFKLELELMKVRLRVLQGDLSKAFSDALALVNKCERFEENLLLVRTLLLLSNIQIQNEDAISALPHVLRCVSLCSLHGFQRLEWEAVVCVAELHRCMGLASHGIECIHKVLPLILENGSVQVKVRALLTIAKCVVDDDRSASSLALRYLHDARKVAGEVAHFRALVEDIDGWISKLTMSD